MKFLVCAIRSPGRKRGPFSIREGRRSCRHCYATDPPRIFPLIASLCPTRRNGRGAALRHLKRPSTDSRSAGSYLFALHRPLPSIPLSLSLDSERLTIFPVGIISRRGELARPVISFIELCFRIGVLPEEQE